MQNATSEDFVFSLFRQKEAIETPTHQPTLTRRYTEESVAWLEQKIEAGSPFFLYLGHTMPPRADLSFARLSGAWSADRT